MWIGRDWKLECMYRTMTRAAGWLPCGLSSDDRQIRKGEDRFKGDGQRGPIRQHAVPTHYKRNGLGHPGVADGELQWPLKIGPFVSQSGQVETQEKGGV